MILVRSRNGLFQITQARPLFLSTLPPGGLQEDIPNFQDRGEVKFFSGARLPATRRDGQ